MQIREFSKAKALAHEALADEALTHYDRRSFPTLQFIAPAIALPGRHLTDVWIDAQSVILPLCLKQLEGQLL